MKKYPSINQFRDCIRTIRSHHDYQGRDINGDAIYSHKENYPILKFKGTIKLHGTNSAVVRYKDGTTEYQSRERVLSLEEDNALFMRIMSQKNLDQLFERFDFNESFAIFGEWCGGNIQSGVALSGLERMFVIFGITIDDVVTELPSDLHMNDIGIYNILQFKTFDVEIDFNFPERAQNDLIEMTISVENSCPVGKFFGKDGVGEGIVFTCVSDNTIKFKSKGQKHSVSKVKKLNSINVEELSSINEFVEYSVTENRLNQGITFMNENGFQIESKNTGTFIQWVVKDVLKEESDTITENGIDEKKVKNAIVNKSRMWYLNKVNKF